MKWTGTTAAWIIASGFALVCFTHLTSSAAGSNTLRTIEGEPGAPFDDPNFKLVVIDVLIENGQIDLGEPREFLEYILNQPVADPFDLGFDIVQPAYDYLVRYPLTQAHLASVKQLSFDGGLGIYFYAYPNWSGETDEFDVHSITGISQLPSLKSFELTSMLSQVDLDDLKGLDKLETINIGVPVKNLPVLLELPALKKVNLLDDNIFAQVSDPASQTRAVFDTLKQQGVKVWVHWLSWTGGDAPEAFE